jgi:hypothetical protein
MSFYSSLLLVVGAPIVGAYVWWRIVHSRDGERYLKQRMQGPFVPINEKNDE